VAPPSMPVETIPDPFVERSGMADAATTIVSSTSSAPTISLSSSPASDRGKGAIDDREAGPSGQPEVLVLERIALFPDEEESIVVVPVGRNPFGWGGPRLTWLDVDTPDGEPAFALDDQEEQEMCQDFYVLGRARGMSILYGDTFLCVGRVLMASIFLLGAYGEVRSKVHFPLPRARRLGRAATLEGLAFSVK
jgi:hypothetical protein